MTIRRGSHGRSTRRKPGTCCACPPILFSGVTSRASLPWRRADRASLPRWRVGRTQVLVVRFGHRSGFCKNSPTYPTSTPGRVPAGVRQVYRALPAPCRLCGTLAAPAVCVGMCGLRCLSLVGPMPTVARRGKTQMVARAAEGVRPACWPTDHKIRSCPAPSAEHYTRGHPRAHMASPSLSSRPNSAPHLAKNGVLKRRGSLPAYPPHSAA